MSSKLNDNEFRFASVIAHNSLVKFKMNLIWEIGRFKSRKVMKKEINTGTNIKTHLEVKWKVKLCACSTRYYSIR